MSLMRYIAVDLGDKRTGLAIGDAQTRLVTPLSVLESPISVRTGEQLLEDLAGAIVEQVGPIEGGAAAELVVGLPLNMDGSIGPAARATAKWGQSLAQRTGLPVIFVDERLSSFAAEQSLIDRKRGGERITRKQKKERLDALAAAGFLQAFLDGKLSAFEVEDRSHDDPAR